MRRPLPRWTRVLTGAVLLTALAGCSGDGSDGPTTSTASSDATPSESSSGSTDASPSEPAVDLAALCGAFATTDLERAVGEPFYEVSSSDEQPGVLSCQTSSENGVVLVDWSLQPRPRPSTRRSRPSSHPASTASRSPWPASRAPC